MKHVLEIIDYTYDGLGIGKVDGFPIFVEYAGVGDVGARLSSLSATG